MKLFWMLMLMVVANGPLSKGAANNTNASRRPDVVNIGSILTVNSVVGRVAKIAIDAAVVDVNSNPAVLGGTKLKITTLDSNYSGFLGIVEGNLHYSILLGCQIMFDLGFFRL